MGFNEMPDKKGEGLMRECAEMGLGIDCDNVDSQRQLKVATEAIPFTHPEYQAQSQSGR